MQRHLARLFFVGAILHLAPLAASPAIITIETVPVGNPGNLSDVKLGKSYGTVAYSYRIGATEVTNEQYAAFLNAKAKSDPFGLWNPDMGSSNGTWRGGITRSGLIGNYVYAVKPNMAEKPVNHVGWYDAIRFSNWLHNGQGMGDTETGAYTLLGGTPVPTNGEDITRNSGANWFLPSEDEWYKSAYYDPTLNIGNGGYWEFPTRSNIEPTVATANTVGDISNPGFNVVNYNSGADWNGQNGNVTTVGSAGPLSTSFYGTFDQGGNVYEWNERSLVDGYYRGLRGASWFEFTTHYMRATNYNYDLPAYENFRIGFRVATIPEPSSGMLAAIGGVALWWLRRRCRRA